MSTKDGPGEGTWSVFAAKVVEERDAARDALAERMRERDDARSAADAMESERNRERRDRDQMTRERDEARAEMHAASALQITRLADARADAATLRARVAVLESALRPFAERADDPAVGGSERARLVRGEVRRRLRDRGRRASRVAPASRPRCAGDPVTPPDIAALRALSEAATAGPWHHGENLWACVTSKPDGHGRVLATASCSRGENARADAALIAAARNALPGLLDEVERLRRIESAARARLDAEADLALARDCAWTTMSVREAVARIEAAKDVFTKADADLLAALDETGAGAK